MANWFLDKLKLSQRSWVAVIIVVFLAIILVAVLVSFLVRSPHEAAIRNSTNSLVVTSRVENKEFQVESDTFDGIISTGATQDIFVPGANESSVVTQVGVNAGDKVETGEVLGRVSGRPLILLQLPFSPYRDINGGDSGDDVKALQNSLAALGLFRGYADGNYGALTAQAVEKLYKRNGLNPPPKPPQPTATGEPAVDPDSGQEAAPVTVTPTYTPLLKSEIVGIGTTHATVAKVASLGAVLSPDKPFATLTIGAPTATFRATVSQAESLKVGMKLKVTDPTERTKLGAATIQSIGDFTNASEIGSFAGYDIVANLEGDTSKLNNGDKTILVPVEGDKTVKGLCVPVTALRQEGKKNYVILARTRKKHQVEVNQTIDGYAILKGNALKAGTEVIVSVQS